MARIGNIDFIPTTTAGGNGLLSLDQIPDEVKQEVEAVYEGLKANPNGRMRVQYETVGELAAYVLQVQSYCAQRPEGSIRFRKSPTRGLPDTAMDYRITDLREEKPETVAVQGLGTAAPAVGTPLKVPAKATAGKR